MISTETLETIVATLGPKWSIVEQDPNNQIRRSIRRKDGMTISFWEAWTGKDVIKVDAAVGVDFDGNHSTFWSYNAPEIGVSFGRPAEAIAKEIQRRLLTQETENWWAAAQQSAKESVIRYQEAVATEAMIRNRYPTKPRQPHERKQCIYGPTPTRWTLTIQPNNPNKVNLSLEDLTIEQAIKLLDIYHPLTNQTVNNKE